MKTSISRLIIIVLGVYLVFGAYLYLIQKSMIYFPDDQNFAACQSFPGYENREYGGTRFYYRPRETGQVFIYYHGNAGSACDRGFTKHIFEQTGASILYVEYVGYSADPREPSMEMILQDVHNISGFVASQGYQDMIVYGQSIGSGAASYHASLGGVDHLILVTPFSRLQDIAQQMFPIYPMSVLVSEKYDNVRWLEDYLGSVLIVHGDDDIAIPDSSSRYLYDRLVTSSKQYEILPGLGHNDIWGSMRFREILENYLVSIMN